jgi:hypothetical protein
MSLFAQNQLKKFLHALNIFLFLDMIFISVEIYCTLLLPYKKRVNISI